MNRREGPVMTKRLLICLLGSALLHAVLFISLTKAPPGTPVAMPAVDAFLVESPVARTPKPKQLTGFPLHPEVQARETDKTQTMRQEQWLDTPPSGGQVVTAAYPSDKIKAASEQPPAPAEVPARVATGNGPSVAAKSPVSAGPPGEKHGIASASPHPPPGIDEVMVLGEPGSPRFVHREAPAYPFAARKLGKEGKVVLSLALDARGQVQEIRVIEANGFGFAESASAAIRKSTFAPAVKSGRAVSSQVLVPVRFVLHDGP